MNASLIVTIVRKGWANAVMEASIKAGAHGGTILFGRGTGIHEKQKFMGIQIEPEKEVLLTIVLPQQVDAILKEIVEAGELHRPGAGAACVLSLDKVIGAIHMKQFDPTT